MADHDDEQPAPTGSPSAEAPAEPEHHEHHLQQTLQHEVMDHVLANDSFGPILLLALVMLFLMTLGADSLTARLFGAGLAATVVMLTIRRAHVKPRLRRVADILTIVALGIAVIGSIVDNQTPEDLTLPRVVSSAFIAVLLLMSVPAVLRRVLTMTTVDMNALSGALVAYLLLGMFFSAAYSVANAFVQPFFAQLTDPTGSDFTYFSFITITTTGYGDLSPGNSLARSMAMLEAVIGQIFLVTVVARVVAMLGTTRQITTRLRPPDGGAGATPASDDEAR